MFGRKKETTKPKAKPRARGGLAQYGLFDVPDVNDASFMGDGDDDVGDDDEDDSQLEAELLALTKGNVPVRPSRSRAAPPPPPKVNLDESLRDIPTDEELSGDEDDPELLAELGELAGGLEDVAEEEEGMKKPAPPPPSPRPAAGGGNPLLPLLEERLKMYQLAEKNAKDGGEASRARRFGRGIGTLTSMIKQAKAGHVVNEEEIPPPVAVTIAKKQEPAAEPTAEAPAPPAAPSRPAPPPPPPTAAAPTDEAPASDPGGPPDNSEAIRILTARQNEYKMAALQAKKMGDKETAIAHIRVVKQFDIVIAAGRNGEALDLSDMPPPPAHVFNVVAAAEPAPPETRTEEATVQQGGSDEGQEEGEEGPPPPSSVAEALRQRLERYAEAERAAKEEGNASKARRMGRIVKQYQDAIRLHEAGKPIPVDDLPTPPGFAPIPREGGSAPAPAPAPAAAATTPTPTRPSTSEAPAAAGKAEGRSPAVAPAAPEGRSASSVRTSPQSRQEKQLNALLRRQKSFKEAALGAKRKGEVAQAREYLRLAKGIDPLLEATRAGLPVDMDTVPIAPSVKESLESDFDIVNIDDCIPGSDGDILEKLEEDLLKQARMCLTTRDHFKAVGDVASANRFEQMAVHSKKDLDTVRFARKRNDPVPKFHYEMRSFSIVQCCTDLGDNDLELTVLRGISYNVPNPKDVDTYVKFEFPYPAEAPQRDRTAVVKDTNSPEYNHTFPLQIQRNVRACQRIFKRQSLKVEVWSRGGFFRGDQLLGTAQVKLQPLETKCVLHDSFDLLDGRKPVGGKVEVKLRLRDPIVAKQLEQMREKWLVIDGC